MINVLQKHQHRQKGYQAHRREVVATQLRARLSLKAHDANAPKCSLSVDNDSFAKYTAYMKAHADQKGALYKACEDEGGFLYPIGNYTMEFLQDLFNGKKKMLQKASVVHLDIPSTCKTNVE